MLFKLYQSYLAKSWTSSELLTLKILLWLVQVQKEVKIETLASCFPLPILMESRRKKIQRFLSLPKLSVVICWFPLIKLVLEKLYTPGSRLIITLDRTQWQTNNILLLAVWWKKRALPIYWLQLKDCGSSDLLEQQAVLKPVLRLLKQYQLVVIGDREFRSTALSSWLAQRGVSFIFRINKNTTIQLVNQDYQSLSSLGIRPGTRKMYSQVYLTQSPQINSFNLAVYWRRKYRNKQLVDPWYLVTNLTDLGQCLTIYAQRAGIEALFRDCKTGGYNLESTKVNDQRLSALILIIAMAYTAACLSGVKAKNQGIQSYLNRWQESSRIPLRHSNFWVGLYGFNWIIPWTECQNWVIQLMALSPHKLPFYQRGLRAMSLIQTTS